ncbi:MAG: hypothetical protein AAF515_08630 [Pseudomonadota bacterium]
MQRLFLKSAWWPLAIGASILLIGALAAYGSGNFDRTTTLPRSFDTFRQLVGINLVLILSPAFLVTTTGYLHRRSLRLLAQLPAPIDQAALRARIHAPARWLWCAAIAGALYGIFFNLPIRSVEQLFADGARTFTLIVLMVLVWIWAGLVIAIRIHVSGLFLEAGRSANLDPFDLRSVYPIATSGNGDIVLCLGAMAIVSLQSIDANFRYQNYLYASLVAIPAATALWLRPMLGVRAQLRAFKRQALHEVNEHISTASRDLRPAPINGLESLLQRRDRIRAVRDWPVDMALLGRVLVICVIPPAAWVAAALVENLVDAWLGGG